jgi:hypothetical protein
VWSVDTHCGVVAIGCDARWLGTSEPQVDHAASNWLLATLSARQGMACLGSLAVCAMMLAAERSFSGQLRTLKQMPSAFLRAYTSRRTLRERASSTTPFTSIPEMEAELLRRLHAAWRAITAVVSSEVWAGPAATPCDCAPTLQGVSSTTCRHHDLRSPGARSLAHVASCVVAIGQ